MYHQSEKTHVQGNIVDQKILKIKLTVDNEHRLEHLVGWLTPNSFWCCFLVVDSIMFLFTRTHNFASTNFRFVVLSFLRPYLDLVFSLSNNMEDQNKIVKGEQTRILDLVLLLVILRVLFIMKLYSSFLVIYHSKSRTTIFSRLTKIFFDIKSLELYLLVC